MLPSLFSLHKQVFARHYLEFEEIKKLVAQVNAITATIEIDLLS
jgi:hypothetical protein